MQRSGESLSKDERRNSSSCPMIWSLVYAGREDEIRNSASERADALLEELALVRKLSVSSFLEISALHMGKTTAPP